MPSGPGQSSVGVADCGGDAKSGYFAGMSRFGLLLTHGRLSAPSAPCLTEAAREMISRVYSTDCSPTTAAIVWHLLMQIQSASSQYRFSSRPWR